MLVVIYGYKPELDRRFVRLSFVVTRVGGHWELRAEALLKAVWWGYASWKPADALVFLYGYGFLSGGKTGVKFCMRVWLLP